MPDLQQIGQTWLANQLAAYVSRLVQYQRGSAVAVLPATVGQFTFRLVDDFGGVFIQRSDRDFIFRAADLILDGTPITPERGDRIRETVGNEVVIYEVRAPGGEDVYRYNPHRTTVRVHTVEVGRAE